MRAFEVSVGGGTQAALGNPRVHRSILLALLLLSVPHAVQAQFTFTTNNGALTITGYTGPGGDVTIPDTTNGMPVTGIGSFAFRNQSSLTNVTIPNSVTSIGNSAFSYCTSLTNITIPSTVTNIGNYAFSGCSSLANATIGNSVTSIGSRAFSSCTSLISITIPNSVISIGGLAFAPCTSLNAITVDAGNSVYSSLDGVLFDKGTNTLIQCPGGKAGSYTVPNSVTSIGGYSFYSCTSLTNITIPNSVTNIGDVAFYQCSSLVAITVDALNTAYSSLDGVLFNKGTNTLIQCPGGKAGSYTVPNGVTSIGFRAFDSCISLTSVTIGNGVTSIGVDAFGACTSLSTITVDALNTFYSSVDGVLFNKSTNTLIQCPGGKAGSYTVPNSVTNIGYYAFYYCTSLTSVTIPNSVINIGSWAFEFCTSLTSITIPNTVTRIEDWAFLSCTNLAGAYFQGNAPYIVSHAFLGDNNVTLYYLPGTTGWGATVGFPPLPTALWQPNVLTSDSSFGVQTNQFGFNISWSSGMNVAVDACPDLANPVWTPLQTNTLTADTLYFSDADWTNHPARFYRLRWP